MGSSVLVLLNLCMWGPGASFGFCSYVLIIPGNPDAFGAFGAGAEVSEPLIVFKHYI